MHASLFIRGLLLGLSVAAAVGPMAILCVRRTLAQGRTIGFVTGMGIATADGCYALVAAFGLTFVSEFLIERRTWLEALGGAFLCYLGWRIIRTRPTRNAATTIQARDLLSAYGSALALTLTNPLTIVSFVAMFAGLGLANAGNYGAGGMLVLGVFLGSAAWWLCLTTAVKAARDRLTETVLYRINLAAGSVILGFGAVAIASASMSIA
jgi:threonine/homoserine/homoserine lactone efflux protein